MNDSMVTARMPLAKKEAGSRVLSKLGSNASQLINEVYDYLIANNASPCAATRAEGGNLVTHEQLAGTLAAIDALCLPRNNRFASMSDADIKMERLMQRGLLEE